MPFYDHNGRGQVLNYKVTFLNPRNNEKVVSWRRASSYVNARRWADSTARRMHWRTLTLEGKPF